MGGHRRLRLSSRKNYERKKRQKRQKRQKLSFLVSISLQLYVQTPATTLEQLFFKLEQRALPLPQGICIACRFEFGIGIVFFKIHMQIGNVN